MKLKAMRNYEELRQVEKDHGKMMDEFIESAKEARALLDQGTDDSPKGPSYYHQPGQGEDHQLSKIQGGATEQSCAGRRKGT